MKTTLIQMNPTVGALRENAEQLIARAEEAAQAGADLAVFPELSLTGYPPEDLILKPHFLADTQALIQTLAKRLPPDLYVLAGAPWRENEKTFNAALLFHDGALQAVYKKNLLPNYGVFDEKRLFDAGTEPLVFDCCGVRVGVHICEDSWPADGQPVQAVRKAGVDLAVNLSASPYHCGKITERRNILTRAARRIEAPIAYCNLIGGQDELVFDGGSKVVLPSGEVACRAPQFIEALLTFEVPLRGPFESAPTPPEPEAEVYEALKLGLRDYVNKNGFKTVLIAVSGGIDSALVAAIAVDALGPDRVNAVTMPSQYSSGETLSDAVELCRNLGIPVSTLPIRPLYDRYIETLQPLWPEANPDVTEENLQARIRGTLVMAISNKTGSLVLTTGNKSEMAVGYCTLYGDMCGGFAVIKDVPKTLVFRLSRWRNAQSSRPVIPVSTLDRPPSAELRPDQKDTDSLPPYEVLDAVLQGYVEEQLGFDALTARGFDAELVRRIIRLVDLNEYKRRQGAPGIKITPRAFGRDRRMPITNGYRG